MVRRVDGALGAAVVSVEGLVIEAVDRRGETIEPDAAYAEYGQPQPGARSMTGGSGEAAKFILEGRTDVAQMPESHLPRRIAGSALGGCF